MFKSNKTTNFNKKTQFKLTCLCIVRFTDTIRFIYYTPMYRTIHKHLLYDFTIQNFLYTIQYVSHIVRYWQLYWQDDRKLVTRLQSRGGIGGFLFQPSWGFLPSSIRPYRLCKSHSWNLSQKFIPYLTKEANPTQPYVIILISDFTLYAFATK